MAGFLPSECRISRATIHQSMPLGAGELQPHAPLQVLAIENPAGDLLDAAFGGIEMWNGRAAEQRERGAQFRLYLRERGVAAVRAALMTDLLQAIRADRQSEQLGAVWCQCGRPLIGLKVVIGQLIVRRQPPVLEREV